MQTFHLGPPEPNLANLSLFLGKIQGPLPNHSRHTTRPNLTSPFQTGSRICLLDTLLYINKIEDHLANATTYKKLITDLTQATRNGVLSTLNYLHITHQIDDQTRCHLTPPNLALNFSVAFPKSISPTYHLDQ